MELISAGKVPDAFQQDGFKISRSESSWIIMMSTIERPCADQTDYALWLKIKSVGINCLKFSLKTDQICEAISKGFVRC